MRSLSNVVAACALLALVSADAWSRTTCDLVLSLADLAGPGELIEHKTDTSVRDCTIQLTTKVDKVSPDGTIVDFKIDRSCEFSGQTQLTGSAAIEIGSPPATNCNIVYDNPADMMKVGGDTLIADVPQLQQLILDAAQATAGQFLFSDPTAYLLVGKLTEAAYPESMIYVAEKSTGATPLPEPGTLGLLAIGLVGSVWVGRRKPKKQDSPTTG